MFTGRINSGQSEKAHGLDLSASYCNGVALEFVVRMIAPHIPPSDTWELELAPWVNTLAWPIKGLPKQTLQFSFNVLVQVEIRLPEIPSPTGCVTFPGADYVSVDLGRLPGGFLRTNTQASILGFDFPPAILTTFLPVKQLQSHLLPNTAQLFSSSARRSLFYLFLWLVFEAFILRCFFASRQPPIPPPRPKMPLGVIVQLLKLRQVPPLQVLLSSRSFHSPSHLTLPQLPPTEQRIVGISCIRQRCMEWGGLWLDLH